MTAESDAARARKSLDPRVPCAGRGEWPDGGLYTTTTTTWGIHYTSASGVKLNVKSNRPGIRFEGTLGWIGTQGWTGAPEAEPESILQSEIGPKETHLYTAPDEHRNFPDCVKSRQPCYAPAEVGHRTLTTAHLGNITMKLGRKLTWNPDTERFVGDDSANAMLARPRRAPWKLPKV